VLACGNENPVDMKTLERVKRELQKRGIQTLSTEPWLDTCVQHRSIALSKDYMLKGLALSINDKQCPRYCVSN